MNDRIAGWLCVCWLLVIVGCNRDESTVTAAAGKVEPTDGVAADGVAAETVNGTTIESVNPVTEIDANALLAMRLPADEAAEGWVRLFDGQTLFGWEATGDANFRVEDGKLVVDGGEQALLCTTMPWRDYELVVEFKAEPKTNSGVFLRTPLQPTDPAVDCYEVNIAPDDNPFPTAGIVKRLKAESQSAQPFQQWRTMRMRLEGGKLQVSVDGQLVCDYTDPEPLPAGRIGLQHNRGRVEFRSIKLRPLGLQSLLDEGLSQWTTYPEMSGSFSTTSEGWLHVQGGRTQLETKQSFGNFALLAEYKLPTAEMNSGIFFRCIPGDEMMGYECQLSNELRDGNRLMAADHGTGGIFRRQEARIVMGEVDQWTSVLLVAVGPKMAAWVSGVQVSDWIDDRKPDVNPRRGLRTEPGTIMIQGHDPGTDAMLKQIRVGSLD
ncbi:MAG: DUF1080 domain-containing protein [Rubripirellula sp.]|nr:DUF1080 domain-containing protein [Rubripirellula sp.]